MCISCGLGWREPGRSSEVVPGQARFMPWGVAGRSRQLNAFDTTNHPSPRLRSTKVMAQEIATTYSYAYVQPRDLSFDLLDDIDTTQYLHEKENRYLHLLIHMLPSLLCTL